MGMQRRAEQLFAHAGAVAVGAADEVDAGRGQAAERAQRLGAIRRRAPDAGAGHAHGAEAEAVDRDVAADLELAGGRGRWFRHGDSPRDVDADRPKMGTQFGN